MTAAFVNHVFFVLPIAERIYGAVAAKPIAGIVLVAVLVLFCGRVLAMDVMQATHRSPIKVIGLQAKYPLLVAAGTCGAMPFVIAL